MPGSSPAEAVNNYIGPLQKAISCVTHGVLVVGAGGRSICDKDHALALPGGAELASRDERFRLSVGQEYRIIKPDKKIRSWKIQTLAYIYELEGGEGERIVAYHWHPSIGVEYPHIHVGRWADSYRPGISKLHIPTGRISLEELIRFTIEQLGVVAVREDWSDALRETHDAFRRHKSW